MATQPAACDLMHCLVLGWERSPEWMSIEGGTDIVLRLPITAVLVRSPSGWVLLETGLDPRPYRGVRGHDIYPYGLPGFPTTGDPLLEALASRGVAPGDLSAAAVSHLHLDHSGDLRHLAGRVPVAIQRRELEFATERAGRADAYVREDYALERLAWRVLDGDAEIVPGIDAIATPGHMSYRVRMRRSGTWLFAVDAIDLQRGIDEDRVIGRAAGQRDRPSMRASHDRLVTLARQEQARLVAGHCPQTWPRLRCQPIE